MQFFVFSPAYKPNEAPTNRLLSFLKGFDEQGVSTTIVFAYPSKNMDKLDDSIYNNTQVIYLWDKCRIQNKVYKYLHSFISVKHFTNSLHSEDVVFLVGGSQYLSIFVKRKDIRLYQERTEHPEINPVIPGFMQKNYLKSCKRLSGMFVISTTLKKVFENLGVENVNIVNMTVDSNRFIGLVKQSTKCKYIAYCGTASNNKDGVDELVKAFAWVHKKYPELRLHIIGKTPSRKDKSGNMALIKSLGLKEVVVFTGIIPASEMPQHLKDAEVLVLDRPDSLQAKCGFPTKLGEYLLSGNPVVVTGVGDIPLFLKDGETALLSQERKPHEFAKKIIWALEHPVEAAEIGFKGSQVALTEFNYKTEARKIIDVIFNNNK